MNYIEIIGYSGCLCLSLTFIPQTRKILVSKSYDSMDGTFLYMIILTSVIMSTYGFFIKSYPVLIANISVFINNFILLFYKNKDKNKILI